MAGWPFDRDLGLGSRLSAPRCQVGDGAAVCLAAGFAGAFFRGGCISSSLLGAAVLALAQPSPHHFVKDVIPRLRRGIGATATGRGIVVTRPTLERLRSGQTAFQPLQQDVAWQIDADENHLAALGFSRWPTWAPGRCPSAGARPGRSPCGRCPSCAARPCSAASSGRKPARWRPGSPPAWRDDNGLVGTEDERLHVVVVVHGGAGGRRLAFAVLVVVIMVVVMTMIVAVPPRRPSGNRGRCRAWR